MPPTADQITAALDALEADAVRWADASAGVRGAAQAARTAAIEPQAFSFVGSDVAATYEALRTKMSALLDGGAANFTSIATALSSCAAAYAADEAAKAHALRGIY
jgi:hypothetical protein